jgi:hypothetical protein
VEQQEGPFLGMAVLCERVLTEQDGTLSLIRVVDRVTRLVPTGPGATAIPPPQPIPLQLVLSFRSGAARGSHQIAVQVETPSGLRLPENSFSILLEGEDRGANVILNLQTLTLDQEGVYWFDILLAGNLITRVPLRIVHQLVTLAPPPSP